MRNTLKRQRSPAFGGKLVPAGARAASALQGRNETAVQPLARPEVSWRAWTWLWRPAASQPLSKRPSGRSTHRSTTVFAGFHSISAYERPLAPTSRNSSTTSSVHSGSSRVVSVCQGEASVTSKRTESQASLQSARKLVARASGPQLTRSASAQGASAAPASPSGRCAVRRAR
jgi:hypothetical protein